MPTIIQAFSSVREMKAFLHQNFEEGVYKMLVGVKTVWPFANNLPIYILCVISIAVLKMIF